MPAPEPFGDEVLNLGGRYWPRGVVAALVEDVGAGVALDPDGSGAGWYVDAADVVAVDLVDADGEAVGARVAEAVLEQRVQPVHVTVRVGGFDLGVVIVETDGLAAIGDADQ